MRLSISTILVVVLCILKQGGTLLERILLRVWQELLLYYGHHCCFCLQDVPRLYPRHRLYQLAPLGLQRAQRLIQLG